MKAIGNATCAAVKMTNSRVALAKTNIALDLGYGGNLATFAFSFVDAKKKGIEANDAMKIPGRKAIKVMRLKNRSSSLREM